MRFIVRLRSGESPTTKHYPHAVLVQDNWDDYGPGEDAERVAEKLVVGAKDFEEVSGPNYWLAKLYRALASNEDFCDGGFEAVQVQAQAH